MSFTLRPYQQEAVDRSVEFLRTTRGKNGLVMLPTGCHAKGTRILMADMTTKAVEDIEDGDMLRSPWGIEPRTVLNLCVGRDTMYRITPRNPNEEECPPPFIVNGDHVLALWGDYGGECHMKVREWIKDAAHWAGRAFLMNTKNGTKYYGFMVEEMEEDEFYGFTLDGDHLYLTEDFTVHHNSGKSLVIAGIVKALGAPTLVFQPSKEILEQNAAKYRSYGYGCGVYSASAGEKNLRDVTFATIGSVVRKKHLLERFKYVLVDECHLVSAKANLIRDKHSRVVGEKLPMYAEVLEHMNVPVLGLTATPYRLSQGSNPVTYETYSELKMLTRTRPRVFDEIVYHVQNRELFEAGYLAKLVYHEVNVINRNALQRNSTGADYTDRSVREQYKLANFNGKVVSVVKRLLEIGRKNVLVFTRFTEEARFVAAMIPGAAIVTAETPSKERERVLRGFRDGWIKVVCNVGILTTGFDYPELEAVVMARPTMSLALWYQIVGRGIRPHPDKDHTMIIDMGGNLRQFGKVEDLELSNEGGWHIHSQGRILTGVPMDARPMPRKSALAR
jgi:DNA repair protein RadD